MRYLIVPPPAEIRNPQVDDGPVIETISFARVIRVVLSGLVQNQSIDAVDADDLRTKCDRAPVGSVLELTDTEHAALVPDFKRPKMGSGFVLGGGIGIIRAILTASDKKPDPLGATEASAN